MAGGEECLCVLLPGLQLQQLVRQVEGMTGGTLQVGR